MAYHPLKLWVKALVVVCKKCTFLECGKQHQMFRETRFKEWTLWTSLGYEGCDDQEIISQLPVVMAESLG